jgi:hypothetical protein
MSSIIRSVLSPLVKLWLRSQTEAIDTLEIEITGRDGQILKGLIPTAKVMATGVIYQGLHLSNLCLTASEIRLNMPEILRKEPLKLLQPIYVNLELNLTPSDLNHCLRASLLTDAVLIDAGGGSFEHIQHRGTTETDDQDTLASLKQILEHLGDEFKLEHLAITDGHCHCKGVFMVNAS